MLRTAACIVVLLALLLSTPAALCDQTEADLANAGGAEEEAKIPASARLNSFDEDQRANASLSLEPLNDIATAHRSAAAAVEDQWRLGNYGSAISALEQLEAAGAFFAPCVSWIEPVEGEQPEYYQDVRIGGTRVDAEDVAIDYDRVSGNIFVATSWGGAGDNAWTLNISTDRGVNWSESFFFGAPALIDMVVVDDYVYVAYRLNDTSNEARLRRFSALTGAEDTTYSVPSPHYHTVANVSPNSIVDIIAGANADYHSNRIYCSFIDSAHNIGFHWDESSDGETFSDFSPVGFSADTGLDYHWNTDSKVPTFQWLSYIGTDNAIHTLNFQNSAWNHNIVEASFTGSTLRARTRISAYADNIFVAYDHQYTEGRGVKYMVSYDAGNQWSGGALYIPGAGDPIASKPDISARSGLGSAVIYNLEEGATDWAYHTARRGYASGPWDDPFPFSNVDVQSGSENYIQWIGSGACVGSYALVYFSDTDKIPYFDLTTPRGFFCDGFESGNLNGWDTTYR